MYLLDTNVVSELRKRTVKRCDDNVARWAASISFQDTYISVITLMEIEVGRRLVERRDQNQGAHLKIWLDALMDEFKDRTINVDTAIALRTAELHIPNPKQQGDSIIAATAMVHSMSLATRNVSDFDYDGLTVINPWNKN